MLYVKTQGISSRYNGRNAARGRDDTHKNVDFPYFCVTKCFSAFLHPKAHSNLCTPKLYCQLGNMNMNIIHYLAIYISEEILNANLMEMNVPMTGLFAT